MERIIIGGLSALLISTSIYVWNSNEFTKAQKILLLTCFIFPPAQWIGIIIILIYNNYKFENTPEKLNEKKVIEKKIKLNSSIDNLLELKEKGILTIDEYNEKVDKIESHKIEEEIKNSSEYKQLKSLFDNKILTSEEFENKIKLLKTNKTPNYSERFRDKLNYSDEDLIFNIKKRVNECNEQNFKDSTFLRGIIMTLSLRDNCKQVLARYKLKYNEDLCDQIRLKCTDTKISNYILEPLINKEITHKKL